MKRVEDIPDRLRQKRKILGVNQVEAAQKIGMHPNTFSNAERGGPMSRNTRDRLLEWLGEPKESEPVPMGIAPIANLVSLEPSEFLAALARWFERADALSQRLFLDAVASCADRTSSVGARLVRNGDVQEIRTGQRP